MASHQEDIIWDAAKLDAAIHVFNKVKKVNFFRRFWKRHGYNYLNIDSPLDDEDCLREVEKCSIINLPHQDRKGRRISICERAETDRKLVYHSIKIYRQFRYIDQNVVPLDGV